MFPQKSHYKTNHEWKQTQIFHTHTSGELLGLGDNLPAYKLPINTQHQKLAVSHPRRLSALHHTQLVNVLASPARGLGHKNRE